MNTLDRPTIKIESRPPHASSEHRVEQEEQADENGGVNDDFLNVFLVVLASFSIIFLLISVDNTAPLLLVLFLLGVCFALGLVHTSRYRRQAKSRPSVHAEAIAVPVTELAQVHHNAMIAEENGTDSGAIQTPLLVSHENTAELVPCQPVFEKDRPKRVAVVFADAEVLVVN